MAGYVVVGLTWVLFSDVVVNTIGGVGLVGQSLKGGLFVLATAAVLAAGRAIVGMALERLGSRHQ